MSSTSSAAAWVRPSPRWLLPHAGNGLARPLLEQELGLEPLVAAVLAARGYAEPEAARHFLSPQLGSLHDPLLMRDMGRAATRLMNAIQAQESILLYGDYDVDGTSSIVVLKKAIEILGGRADFHIPHRLKDGYGMRSEVIEQASADGVRLIVSVDTGIRANQVVERANTFGVDVIVTDHHLPEADLPPALAVLNPNRPDCEYPNKNLCGAGVTFKLVQALLAQSGMAETRRGALLESFLKPVAIATVADIVPLTDENRVIVRRGLSGLRQVRNTGLRALLKVAGFDEGDSPSAQQVAFRLAPRINAAGRMATARDVIELLLTEDGDRAKQLAEQLDALNRERQQAESDIVEAILRQCEERPFHPDSAGLVFAGEGWHLGVLGIVASRLVERFCRPVFVVSEAATEDEEGRPFFSGSGRSIPAFHLLEALEAMPELFAKFGGHRQAAGLTLRARDVEQFQQRFDEFARAKLSADDLRAQHIADAEASFAELSDRCVRQLMSLGPFGFGNPAPVFYCARAVVAGPAKVLKDGRHFSVPLKHNGRVLFCKAWNFGERAALFEPGAKIDLLFQIEEDPMSRKRGYGWWCLSLKDVRLSKGE
ncbi:MAG: single-stranded-DNA-specific exonuclease RecJ [Acidobacteriaceae bacterium]|nr:single-stranded-DNA-specific exonuclease RecJ [Acidobacteriaceae bacterium]